MKILFADKSEILYEQRKHSHNYYEIAITISGDGITFADNRKFKLKRGSILILPPGVPHSHMSKNGLYNIFICTDKITINPDGAVLYLDNTDILINIANMIYTNCIQKEFNYEAINQKLLEAFFEYVIRLHGKSSRYEFVQRFKDIITENFSNPSFEIPTEAEKLGISFDYMRHCFKEEISMTPLEYLTQIRIEQAKNHLSSSDVYSVSEIANMCGFCDQYYFSKVFKKAVGVSPRDYRKNRNSSTNEHEAMFT